MFPVNRLKVTIFSLIFFNSENKPTFKLKKQKYNSVFGRFPG